MERIIMNNKKQNLIIDFHHAIGDLVVATSVLRDLYKSYKDWMSIDIHSYYPEILENNPYLTKLSKDDCKNDVIKILHSDISINRNSMDHYSTVLNKVIQKKLQLEISQTSIYPEIYLSEEEKDRNFVLQKFEISGKYIIINCGFKNDIILKQYPIFHWDKIIKELTKRNIQIVQVGSNRHNHTDWNNGIKNLVGQTENFRDLLALCYHSEASINHMSLNTHIMAAFNKPCFTIAGGRENPRFETYPNQQFFHTVGLLDCCLEDGCWKKQRSDCKNLVGSGFSYPKCMTMINPSIVIDSVLNFL
jgi:ADP-heptose:LPS heptosyltransferase